MVGVEIIIEQLKEKAVRLLHRVNSLLDRGENNTSLSITKEVLEILNGITDFINKENKVAVNKKIKSLLDEREQYIKSEHTPFKQSSNTKVIAHLIPFTTLENDGFTMDLSVLKNRASEIPLLSGSSYDYKFNYEGFLTFNTFNQSYVQIFRNGYLEAVDTRFFNESDKHIYALRFESSLIKSISSYLKLYSELGVQGPYLLNISIIGVKDFTIAMSNSHFFDQYPNENEEIYLPQIVIKNSDDVIANVLKPVFDVLWNTVGIYGSISFKDGQWNPEK